MQASPLPTSTPDTTEHLAVGELSRRLAAELASAAAICRDCEHLAGDLAQGGATIENLARLQALDELSQRLHGLSEVLYAFTSAANNNGSAFAGLTANTPWFNTALGVAMLLGRFIPIALVLALAGSLAAQDKVPATVGTLPTHRPQFAGLLTGVIVIVTALTYFPVLTLGPLAEGLA